MSTSQKSLKKFAPEQLELAFGKALRELTGEDYAVSIAQIDFSCEVGLAGPGRVPLQVSVRRILPEDPSIPF